MRLSGSEGRCFSATADGRSTGPINLHQDNSSQGAHYSCSVLQADKLRIKPERDSLDQTKCFLVPVRVSFCAAMAEVRIITTLAQAPLPNQNA
jgi:hypothetical protein